MEKLNLNSFLFGGDYSPEQWSEDIWEKDIQMMKELGVDTVTLNVHSWVIDEPREGEYDFTFLDKVVNKLKAASISVVMATGSTMAPAWLYKKDPGSIRTDIKGRPHKHGVREMFCPTNPSYKAAVKAMVNALAEHFKNESNIILWHLNNELSGFCYCEHCEKIFRDWLKEKYETIDNLNKAWCTTMWGRKYTTFDDIVIPSELNEVYLNANGMGIDLDSLPTEAIEYSRFMSDMHRKLFEMETEQIKKHIPHAVCTNNYQFRGRFDYHRIAKTLDIISLDVYPNKNDPSYNIAFNLDSARNFIEQDKPFMIMEMTPNHASWAEVCAAKRPGEVALYAMENIAHGANSSLFFQIRRTPAGFEKYHGAMIAHCGHLDTRIAKELKVLSADLKKLPIELQQVGLSPDVAIIHDWDEKLGVEIPCCIQKNIDYSNEVKHYYRYFHENNINIDVISLDQDFSKYKLVVAPMICMIKEQYAKELENYVRNGGILVLTYLSGYTNECDYMYLGGQPGPLRTVAGLWVEEIDGLTTDECNTMVFDDGTTASCGWMCDVIRTENAKPLALYGSDYYKDTPCVLINNFGKGICYYIGAKPDKNGVDKILNRVIKQANITSILKTPDNVHATKRGNYIFVLNYSHKAVSFALPTTMFNILTEKNETICMLPCNGYNIYKVE